jgi:hypothetical protein
MIMSMFDNKVARLISDFGDGWNTPEHKFRQHFASTTDSHDDSFVMYCRANGRAEEFLRISKDEYERCIRLPVQTARQGSNYSTRFFVWHWLEETNQLSKFFNKLKELQNA